MRRSVLRFRNRRGSTIAVVAVALAALLAVTALGIDLGMLFAARNEAQRAADAAALAGASAFLDYDEEEAVEPAHARALDYAIANSIRRLPIDSGEVQVTVLPDSLKVRAVIRRSSIPTWFARFFGVDEVPIAARAAAVASPAGAATCLKPFAIPDAWHDEDDDLDGDRVWDEEEQWDYLDDPGDYYRQYTGDPDATPPETGYGSTYRDEDRDYGRTLRIKVADPKKTTESSVFFPWVIPEDPDMENTCSWGGGGGPGAAAYRANICSCNNSEVYIGQEYEIQTGNMAGPTHQGVQELIDRDPDAYWDEAGDSVAGSAYSPWKTSPRVIKIALYDPAEITKPGKTHITFNNFALVFLESQDTHKNHVIGRFLYYVGGTGSPASTTGPLVRFLQLVE